MSGSLLPSRRAAAVKASSSSRGSISSGGGVGTSISPATKVPALAIIPLVVAHALVVVGGWYLGAALVRADKGRVLLYALGAAALGAVISVATLFPRLTAASSYRGYAAGVVARLMSVELGWAILVSAVATAAAGGYVVFELSRDSRRVRAR